MLGLSDCYNRGNNNNNNNNNNNIFQEGNIMFKTVFSIFSAFALIAITGGSAAVGVEETSAPAPIIVFTVGD